MFRGPEDTVAVDTGKDTVAVVVTVEAEFGGALVVDGERVEVIDELESEAVSTEVGGELAGTNGGAEMFRSGMYLVIGSIGWDTHTSLDGGSVGWLR